MARTIARSCERSTFHLSAAAVISISRAWAPATRSFSQPSRTEVDPPVICAPSSALTYTLPGGAMRTLTLRRSTLSSSAISIGNEV